MTNSNFQEPNICDEELKQLSRDVADWILRLGRHEEKAEQINKGLKLLTDSLEGEQEKNDNSKNKSN